MKPFASGRKRTPSSAALESLSAPSAGAVALVHSVAPAPAAEAGAATAAIAALPTAKHKRKSRVLNHRPRVPVRCGLRRVNRLVGAGGDLEDRVLDAFDRLSCECDRR